MTKLIILEGPDGCGKTSVTQHIERVLSMAGLNVRMYSDPGSSHLGRVLRKHVLLDKHVTATPDELTLLFTAARSATASRIRIDQAANPADVIVLDRWLTSTLVYQGLAGVSESNIHDLHNTYVGDFEEFEVFEFLLSAPFQVLMNRLEDAGDRGSDRFESSSIKSIRERYDKYYTYGLEMIDNTQDIDEVVDNILERIA